MTRSTPTGAAILGCFLWGCGGDTPAKDPGPARLDDLVVAVPRDATDLLAPLAASSFELAVLDLIGARPLDPQFRCELKYRAELAESWQVSADGLTMDLVLRDDLRWEDGTPVTAADLALASSLANDREVGSTRGDTQGLLDPESRPQVIDARRVRYRLHGPGDPAALAASAASLQVVPNHILGLPGQSRSALRTHPLNTTTPLSSGPWRVAEWTKGGRLVLEPNPGYPSAPAGLRRVIFKVIPEYSDRIAALAAGTVDLVEGIQVADADVLASKAPQIKLVRRGYRSMDYVGWNQVNPADVRPAEDRSVHRSKPAPRPHPLFADVRVRTALTTALDIDRLIAETLTSPATGEVYATRAFGTITPELCAIRPEIVPLPHSVDEARRLLAEAGWTDSNGDGVVDRDGTEFRFTLLVPAGSPRREAAAGLMQAQLRAAGVDAQLESLDSTAVLRRLVEKDFDAVFSGWTSGLQPDPHGTFSEGGELNFTSFSDAESERLLRAAVSEPDAVRASELWGDFERQVYSQQPYTFLYWVDEIVGVDGRFQNTRLDLVSPWNDLAAWTVPADQVRYAE